MVASPGFANLLHELLAPLGPIVLRRMFGKTGVFCGGLMFAVVADDALFLRVDETNRSLFTDVESVPLNYVKRGRTIDLAFWRVPERLFDEPEELAVWAEMALAAARRVATKRNPKR